MNFKNGNNVFFFLGINILISALIIFVYTSDFYTKCIPFASVFLLIFNSYLLIQALKYRFKKTELTSTEDLDEGTLSPADILTDIDVELERRRAAKKFERN